MQRESTWAPVKLPGHLKRLGKSVARHLMDCFRSCNGSLFSSIHLSLVLLPFITWNPRVEKPCVYLGRYSSKPEPTARAAVIKRPVHRPAQTSTSYHPHHVTRQAKILCACTMWHSIGWCWYAFITSTTEEPFNSLSPLDLSLTRVSSSTSGDWTMIRACTKDLPHHRNFLENPRFPLPAQHGSVLPPLLVL